MKDKDFKRWLKRKIKVTLGVMISFLILGKLGYADPGSQNNEDEKDFLKEKYVNKGEINEQTLNEYYNDGKFSKYRIFFDPSQSVWNDVAPATIIGDLSGFNPNDINASLINGGWFKNVFATVEGKANIMKSTKSYVGVANSIVGVANNIEDSNGTLIYGAGNSVKNSMENVDVEVMALAYGMYKNNTGSNKPVSYTHLTLPTTERV